MSAAKAKRKEMVGTPIVGTPIIGTQTTLPPTPAGLSERALAALLGLATFIALFVTQAPIGFTRDEGYYFAAASSYEEWIRLFLRAPFTAMGASATEQFFRINSEHPALAKMCFATSHLFFARTLGLLGSAEAATPAPGFTFAQISDSHIGFSHDPPGSSAASSRTASRASASPARAPRASSRR